MSEKNNNIFLGIILIAVALLFLMDVNSLLFSPIAFIICGVVTILLYFTKKKSIALIIGSYLLFFGVFGLFSNLMSVQLRTVLFSTCLFLAPGAVFLILYFTKNKRSLLLPSLFFIWIGVFSFINSFQLPLNLNGGALFCICIGFAFLCSYSIGRYHIGSWTISFATLFFVIGGMLCFNIIQTLMSVVFVVLLTAGIVIIVNQFKKR